MSCYKSLAVTLTACYSAPLLLSCCCNNTALMLHFTLHCILRYCFLLCARPCRPSAPHARGRARVRVHALRDRGRDCSHSHCQRPPAPRHCPRLRALRGLRWSTVRWPETSAGCAVPWRRACLFPGSCASASRRSWSRPPPWPAG
ncbi:hypothetical protein B484DRAFT_285644 [Ochromonadaceae sp. CCMP2298]|nr:hypothetical protein B484DRAFT_285644 [Ochromonadaceae sp. CCMP2298]